MRFDSPVLGATELSDLEDVDLVVEMCITRTLPPALTLKQGLESISEAIEKLKLEPPRSSSGVFRFQVWPCLHFDHFPLIFEFGVERAQNAANFIKGYQ